MAAVREFTLPDLGEGLTEATVVRWLVEVGEVVAVDQPVVEVETAKALVEVPCPYGGVVTARLGEEGSELPVGAPLLTVVVGSSAGGGASAGDAAAVGGAASGEIASAVEGGGPSSEEGPAGEESGNVLVGYGTSASTSRRRRVRPPGGERRSPEPAGAAGAGAGSGADVAGVAGDAGAEGAEGAEGAASATKATKSTKTTKTTNATKEAAASAAASSALTASAPLANPARATGRPGSVVPGPGATGATPGRRGGSVTDGDSGFLGDQGTDSDAGEGAGPDTESGTDSGIGRETGPVPVISPLVRRLAREYGLDLEKLTGSGPDGLILRADVELAARAAASGASAPAATDTAAPPARVERVGRSERAGRVGRIGGAGSVDTAGSVGFEEAPERIPLRGLLGAAAEKFSRSRREIPDATCWVDADATELLAMRTAMNEHAPDSPKISLLALLARICTAALDRFPALNATVDTESREIVRLPAVHIGFAAQTDRGLVVPVVRNAQARTAQGLTEEFVRLTEAARTGRLTPGELTHGTFTLNNYGVFGVDGSTPILNHPEAAMLGVGRIAAKPWVHGGELAVRQVVQLSLTFDHRVCDGGTAGGFLRFVADRVEQPALLLRAL